MNITKEEFIIRLKLVVMADERSCVEDITYWKQPANKKSRVNYGILKVLYRSKTRYQNKTARNVGLKKDIK